MFYNATRIQFTPDEVIEYLRKSRSDDPLLTTEEVLKKHEMELDEWALRNMGEKVPEKNKFREVVSGETLSERPEIQKVLKLIESPYYKAISVVEPSRLTRGDLEDIGKIIKLLRYTGTYVITPHKVYDLTDEYDRDAFERELKRGNEYLEYTKKIMLRGKIIAVREGQYIATYPPYGYKKISYKEGRRTIRTLEIINEEAEVVKMIFDWYVNKNMSMNGVAYKLDDLGFKPARAEHFTKETIQEILSNEVYLGKIRWQYRKSVISVENQEIIKSRPREDKGTMLLFDGLHDALISQEIFDKAQEKRSKNVPLRKSQALKNPLAGILYCKKCGRAMKMREANGKNKRRFECSNIRHCQSSGILYDDVIEKLLYVLEECIEDFEYKLTDDNLSEVAEHEKQIELLERKLESLQRKEVEQWEAQVNPDESQRMPQHIFKQLNEKVTNDIKETKTTLKMLYETVPEKISYEEKIVSFSFALQSLKDETVDADTKNLYLKEIIEKITLDRDKSFRLTKALAKEMGVPYTHKLCWYNHPFHMDITLRD
jgi:hypothetical protein